MTAVPVATRAPESDAQEDATAEDTAPPPHPAPEQPAPEQPAPEQPTSATTQDAVAQSIVPGDTSAQSGPTIGEHCTTDRPLPSTAEQPAGELSSIEGISCYIAKPSTYPHEPAKLLLLLTGGTGVQSVNNQLQADAFAQKGYLVVMPDQFTGDAAPKTASWTEDEQDDAAPELSILDRIKLGAAQTVKSFMIDMWLARHTSEKVLPIVQKVLAAAKEEYADAVANGGGVYGVGYCTGAKFILQLLAVDAGTGDGAGTDAAAGEQMTGQGEDAESQPATKSPPAPALKAAAVAHGSLVTLDDLQNVKNPVALVCVRGDALFPDDVREQGKASLELGGVEHEVQVFDNVPHGFAVVGEYGDATIASAQAAAFEAMVGWLERH